MPRVTKIKSTILVGGHSWVVHRPTKDSSMAIHIFRRLSRP